MKTLLKFVVLLGLAAGAVAFLTSRRGEATRTRMVGFAKEAADLTGSLPLDRALPGKRHASEPTDDEAIRQKIEETRRRLQDRLETGPIRHSNAAA